MDRDQRRLLVRWEARQASLAGSYADYVYQGEALFLQEAAKRINSMARGHGKARVVRQGGRSPFLVYEGEDMNDISLEVTFSMWSSGPADVTLAYDVRSAYSGNRNDTIPYKQGMLRPETLVEHWKTWARVF